MSSDDMEREDWIDEEWDDCLPVFVTKSGDKFHKVEGGCIDSRFANVQYDLFAAELDGYDPCQDCFEEDQYVATEGDR